MAKKKAAKKAAPKKAAKKSASVKIVDVTIPVAKSEQTDAEKFAAGIHKKFDDREKKAKSQIESFDSVPAALKAIGDFFKKHDDEHHFTVEMFSTEDGKINVQAVEQGKK